MHNIKGIFHTDISNVPCICQWKLLKIGKLALNSGGKSIIQEGGGHKSYSKDNIRGEQKNRKTD
jgi:hypothetical protein